MAFTGIDLPDDLSPNPFPRGIADDGWVAYHGTSLAYSVQIEAEGLGYAEGAPPFWGEVQAFMAFTRSLCLITPAIAALRTFAAEPRRLVALGHTFQVAARYARDEPGSETLSVIRRAVEQLGELLEVPDVLRSELDHRRRALWTYAASVGFRNEQSWDVANASAETPESSFHGIDEALELLREPDPLRDAIAHFRVLGGHVAEHVPVVYAVRLSGEDVSRLREVADGMTYDGVLTADRLVARVELHPERVVYHRRDRIDPGFDPEAHAAAVERWRARLSA